MAVNFTDLENWFHERHKWQQDAVRRIVQNGLLVETDFDELLDICIKEASKQKVTFSSIPKDSLNIEDVGKPLRIESISQVTGINALSPTKPLSFGKSPLCIVYGRNGAGKSGYVRLLKHACGARNSGSLLNNIFLSNKSSQSALMSYSENETNKSTQWAGKAIADLRGVDIYDTICGLIYVDNENEVIFEPWILRLFTQLTKACETISQKIRSKTNQFVSQKPNMPIEFASMQPATWYANLNANITSQNFEINTSWSHEQETSLAEVNVRLAETNPMAKAISLRRQKSTIMELLKNIKNYQKMLSDEKCLNYLIAKADAKLKRIAADEDAQKVFAKAPLTGIGTDSWLLMWAAAEKYSKDFAYKELTFPNIAENSRCVLCQQKLDEEGRDRLLSFESFVKGELQRLSAEAEQSLSRATNSFPEIPSTESITIQLDAAHVTDEILKSSVLDLVTALSQRKLSCLEAISADEISKLPLITPLLNLVAFARKLSKLARSYDSDTKNQNRPQLELQSKELSARKWLNQQRKAIEAEISRLRAVHLLNEAERLTNTQGISKKKSIITEELITKAYIGRFQNELKNLKAERLSVELKKTRADTGRVYHRIFLKNAPEGYYNPTDILSEGEFRIVSLAAFLADTEGRNSITPFVFDDPISSLDHVYEEATAQRLVKLSEKRQVIVFTHRLSLVGYIEKYAEKIKIDPHFICLSEYCCGEIISVPIERQKTKTAINTLKNDRLYLIRNAFRQGDDLYAREAKAICSDIRKLLERIVEKDFLNEVVQRFCQEVQTKGKINNLAKIEESDCKFIDDYLTKYSRFEHSQSDETPIPLPQPDEIENDLNEISIFLESIQKRNK